MVFNILSQDDLVRNTLSRLEIERVVGLIGLPGSGKSFSCVTLRQSWVVMDRVAVTVTGDEYQKARRYFPFFDAISQSNVTKELLVKSASGAVAKGATAIPFAGPLAGFVIEKLFNRSVDAAKERYQYLSAEEQNILYYLQRMAGKKTLLLICDDLQFWDESSLALLRIMLSGKVDDAYPFLKETRYVVVQTIPAIDEKPVIDVATLIDEPVAVSSLDYPSLEQLPAVLDLLGLNRPFPPEVIQAIHGICGGHLHVLQQLVSYLQTTDCLMSEDLAGTAGAEFLSGLVESRLKALGPTGSDVLEILRTASIIGTIFSEQELTCLCDRQPTQVRKLLAMGEDMHLIRRGQQSNHFAHGIVHKSLQHIRSSETEELHRQFSLCLRRLRPGDYRSRMRHSLAAGESNEASVLAVCALLQDKRNGAVSLDEAALTALAAENGLMDTLNRLREAQDRIQHFDAQGALRLVSYIDPLAPIQLQAEAVYINAMCLIKDYQYDSREKAIKALDTWIPKVTDEGELNVRMLSTQLVALVHQRREDGARNV